MRFTSTSPEQFKNLMELSKSIRAPKIILQGGFNTSPESLEQLILSDFWPKAVPESLIVRGQEAVSHRSKSIISSFVGNLEGKKFLDFGCGNGGCATTAAVQADYAIGYDIEEAEEWVDGVNLTTNFGQVKENGPYDVILLYDVFDHIEENKINSVLYQMHSVCHVDTIIKVRCHPWTSIHGGHVYEKLNRAYAHLFLTDEQLEKYQSSKVRKISRPLKTYNEAWNSANFTIVKTETHKINWDHAGLGDFFSEDDVATFLNKESPQRLLGDVNWQKVVLPIEFIDFTLRKK